MTRLVRVASLLFLLSLGACARPLTSAPPPAPALPAPTTAPTPSMGFQVAVTPSARSTATPAPTATSTPFVTPPSAAWLRLIPNHGYPVSSTIQAQGGNLPASTPIDLTWSIRGHSSPIIRTASTDDRGRLSVRFPIPASPPGLYAVQAVAGGVIQASADYAVTSAGALAVRVGMSGGGVRLRITGHGFAQNRKLLLTIDPTRGRHHALWASQVIARPDGAFVYILTTRKLTAGQYLLTAISAQFLVPIAQTVFQVVV